MDPASPEDDDHRTGRRRGKVLVIALIVALILATGLSGYLLVATRQWEANAKEWEGKSRELGTIVTEQKTSLDATTADLESARKKVEEYEARITELADEKAQLGDKNAASEQYLKYQNSVSELASNVAAALNQCTTAQSQLIGYLNNRADYEQSEIERFSRQVDEVCAKATEANTALQRGLGK